MAKKPLEINKSKLKDNFYNAVNGEWIQKAKIPADHSSTGGFIDLVDDIEKQLINDSDKLVKNELKPENDLMNEYKKMYEMTKDAKKRNKDGNRPLQPYLERIGRINNYEDLSKQLANWILTGLPLPFSISVDPDMKNTSKYTLFADTPSLFLPDKTYYNNDNKDAKHLMKVFTQMATKLLVLGGYSPITSERIVEEAKAFDRLLVPYVKSAEQRADYSKIYNPQSIDQFNTSTDDNLNLKKALQELVEEDPKEIIVTEPKYFKNLKKILSPKNFDLLKSWITVKTVLNLSGTLSEEFRITRSMYNQVLSGKKEPSNQKKAAYYLAASVFDQVIGDYYGRKYFGEKAKKDVQKMVHNMINVYEKRLKDNNWLGQDTRKKAIEKLKHLEVQVGYPDQIDPLYNEFHVTPTKNRGTVLSNIMDFVKITNKNQFSKWQKDVNRTKWEMSANNVNAYFNPFMNVIVFPAAILQSPFYSLKQSNSANYGGIGAVIAHEISHAFDNNGALFDEYGNLNNWWSQKDQEQFKKLSEKMVKAFDGLPFQGEKVNGKLTVSENIADAGGLSAAEEAAKKDPNSNLYHFFTNWARIWRTKSTKEYKKLLLSTDVHAPAELRAQVQVKNLDDFYTTFDIKPEDKMYLDPTKRVKIW